MGGTMSLDHSKSPEPVYRGLDRCDLCGSPLAKGEALAGICKVCRGHEALRRKDGA
jgi:hypothetical protein